ncbi:hypothetical protein BC938DRAFT_481228 [Jimgerdemannia flammicorona]|uniref:Uncharacterized protein n=1 Tax=Jimgerdemannia flammicorona TaxID=994334 RepID=A0A433QGP8_9FUNG|nr:hypothetical protein BC938DRAFT_481228 [Jimgerdemannia flammicorona]
MVYVFVPPALMPGRRLLSNIVFRNSSPKLATTRSLPTSVVGFMSDLSRLQHSTFERDPLY